MSNEGIKKGKSSKAQYVYYNNSDDSFKWLELLCAEKDIGYDSVEVRNEIVRFVVKIECYHTHKT